MLRECTYCECAHRQHVRRTLTLITLTHTITAYSISGNVVRVRKLICATRQKPCRKRAYRFNVARFLVFMLLMNIIRYIVSSCRIKHKYDHIVPVVMIGQSKINAFFKRQSASSEDHMKTAGSASARPLKRKGDENKSQVSFLCH